MILALSLGESVVNHFARRCCGEIQSSVALNDEVGDEVRRGTYHFSLPRQEDEVATRESVTYLRTTNQRCRSSLDSHPD